MKYSLNKTFAALADPTRRAILARLRKGEAAVSDLATPLRLSLPAISKHLAVLERAGLIRSHKRGRVRRCELHAAALKDADAWLERYRIFWEGRMDSLEKYLNDTAEPSDDAR